MKVLFTARKTLFSQPGGDTQQVVKTADALRELGVKVDIILRGEFVNYASYNLIHFFNLGRPADIVDDLTHITQPLVVSSIWVDYAEYDSMRKGTLGKLRKLIGKDRLEFGKTIARGFNGTDYFPGIKYLINGHRKSEEKIVQRANAIITSTKSEEKRINHSFQCKDKIAVIPLGLPAHFWKDNPITHKEGVICVGRIEGLKNQLNLIKAAKNANWSLKIIGKAAANQQDYFENCQAEKSSNVTFEGWLDRDNLLEAYQNAKVLVLPSYFETFGLVALEAMSQGCNVVMANRPDMNAIFKNYVTFCNPNDPKNICEKINEALNLPPFKISAEQKERHQWQTIGKQILKVYTQVLND